MKSFAAKTKDALAREYAFEREKRCCQLAELTGLALSCGTVTLAGGEGAGLTMRTEHAGVARYIVKLLRTAFALTPAIRMVHASRLGGKTTYEICLGPGEAEGVIRLSGLTPFERKIPRHCHTRRCCRNAFLRGVFLGCGTITAPERGYQMEFIFAGEETGQALARFLQTSYTLRAGVVNRKGSWAVYVKDGDGVVTILSAIGAHAAIFTLENVRIVRDARNRANRAANCDTANISKMLSASERQLQAIEIIERTIGLDALPQTLREVADIRRAHADASLEELGAMLDTPVGKSGIYHRLQRVEAIARSIEQRGEEETK